MENMFEGLETDFEELIPEIQQKANGIAKNLISEGCPREEAIKKAITEVQERNFDLEG